MSTAGKVGILLGGLLVLLVTTILGLPLLFGHSDYYALADAELELSFHRQALDQVCQQLSSDLGMTFTCSAELETVPIDLTGIENVATVVSFLCWQTGATPLYRADSVALELEPSWWQRLGYCAHPEAGYWQRVLTWWGL